LDVLRFYYNFMRIHESLGKTPAQAAGYRYPACQDWPSLLRYVRRRVLELRHGERNYAR
jgi:hypothetical protein